MSLYFMANIKMKNKQAYQKYLDRAGEVFEKFRGTYLAVDNGPEVLEGEWNYSRAVLICFETRKDFDAWYQSDEYQEILQSRLLASECDTILIQGK